MVNEGVLYVATRHDLFLEEAVISADSVRQHYPRCSISLFTDRPSHRLCSLGPFDRVESVEGVSWNAPSWSLGVLNRLKCLVHTPYDHTLYLDTDTTVVSDEIATLFRLTESFDVGMAETSVDDSFSRQFFGRPLFNSGVVIYRRNARTLRWLEKWIHQSEDNVRIAAEVPLRPLPMLGHIADVRIRRKLLGNDQISLAALLTPETNTCELRTIVLDYSWNHRGSKLSERNRTAIKVRHWPRESAEMHARKLGEVIERTKSIRKRETGQVVHHSNARGV